MESSHNSLTKAVSDGGQYGLTIPYDGGAADIRGCHFEGCTVAGVRINGGEGTRLIGHLIPVVPQGVIIENENKVFANIVGNQIHGLGGQGSVAIDIRSPNASQVIISDNTMILFRTGVLDRSAGMNVINGNLIDTGDAEGVGIEMRPDDNASPSTVSANVIMAGQSGILHVKGDRVTYTGNVMTDLGGVSKEIDVQSGSPTILGQAPDLPPPPSATQMNDD